jgi:DNA-binding NtrC family response regulator
MEEPSLLRSAAEAWSAGEDAPGILVVDDDQMLLSLLKTVFQRQGFHVWTATGGQAALDLYERHGERIAVVLLDVLMPGMDGPQTLAELRRLDPLVACCFMSGFTGGYSGGDLEDLGALCCFEKPFRAQELAQELWQIAQKQLRRSA